MVLDDAASNFVDSGCAEASPSFLGNYRPSQALSGFNGLSGNGTWTLTITDVCPNDTGTLNNWSLDLSCN